MIGVAVAVVEHSMASISCSTGTVASSYLLPSKWPHHNLETDRIQRLKLWNSTAAYMCHLYHWMPCLLDSMLPIVVWSDRSTSVGLVGWQAFAVVACDRDCKQQQLLPRLQHLPSDSLDMLHMNAHRPVVPHILVDMDWVLF